MDRTTSEEQQRRQAVIDNARASTELEGGKTPPEARALQDQWVRGEITAAALMNGSKELVKQRLSARRSG